MAVDYRTTLSVTLSGTIPAFTTGITSTVTHTGTSQLRMTGVDSQVSTTHTSGTVTLVRGYTTTFTNSTGLVSTAHGLSALFSLTSPPTGVIGVYVSMSCGGNSNASADWQGFYAALSNSSTTIRSLTFFDSSFSNSGGTITTLKGLNLGGWGTTGTVTNSYGIYADTGIDKGGTLKYFIYSLSVSPSLFSGTVTTNPTLAANTSGDGNVLINSAVASSGNQMYSPRNRYTGQGWKTTATAASQTVDLFTELRPVQGAANPSFLYAWAGQINGGGYTDKMVLTSDAWVGINTSAPEINLHLVGTVDPTGLIFDAIGTVAANFIGRRANGTVGSKTAAASGDNLLVLGGNGWGSSAWGTTSSVSINLRAGETWTNTARGSYIGFETTIVGGTSKSEKMRLDHFGRLGIGQTPTTFGGYEAPLQISSSAVLGTFIAIRNTDATYGMGGVWMNTTGTNTGWIFGTDNSNKACIRYGTGASEDAALTDAKDGTKGLSLLTTGQAQVRIKPRANLVASAATVTFDLAADDVAGCTALVVNVTLAAPSGTPDSEQEGEFLLKDNGTARTITYNAIFRAVGCILPGATLVSKVLRIGWKYNTADTKYDIVAVAQE